MTAVTTLESAERQARKATDRQALNPADLLIDRGKIAHMERRYSDAMQHFNDAAAVFQDGRPAQRAHALDGMAEAACLCQQGAAARKDRFIYMLQGGWDFSNLDPYATKPDGGKATLTGPHVMVVGPGVKMAPGYDRTGNGVDARIPYVMWKDTPYEHLMIPTR